MWLKEERFKELLEGWWHGLKYNGSPSRFILVSQLKALKALLKFWIREVFGRVDIEKNEALRRVSFWDDWKRGILLTVEEVEERRMVREKFKKWSPLWRCLQS